MFIQESTRKLYHGLQSVSMILNGWVRSDLGAKSSGKSELPGLIPTITQVFGA